MKMITKEQVLQDAILQDEIGTSMLTDMVIDAQEAARQARADIGEASMFLTEDIVILCDY